MNRCGYFCLHDRFELFNVYKKLELESNKFDNETKHAIFKEIIYTKELSFLLNNSAL